MQDTHFSGPGVHVELMLPSATASAEHMLPSATAIELELPSATAPEQLPWSCMLPFAKRLQCAKQPPFAKQLPSCAKQLPLGAKQLPSCAKQLPSCAKQLPSAKQLLSIKLLNVCSLWHAGFRLTSDTVVSVRQVESTRSFSHL
jgi:hypothetical protein